MTNHERAIDQGIIFAGTCFIGPNGETFAPWGVLGRIWWPFRAEFPKAGWL